MANQLFPDQNGRQKSFDDFSRSELILAYHVLSCNNGQQIDKDPNGKDSVLFTQLLAKYGTRDQAAIHKAYIYTAQYAATHGEWLDKTGEDGSLTNDEPDISEVEPELDSFGVETVFKNLNSDEEERVQSLLEELCTFRSQSYIEGVILSEHVSDSSDQLLDGYKTIITASAQRHVDFVISGKKNISVPSLEKLFGDQADNTVAIRQYKDYVEAVYNDYVNQLTGKTLTDGEKAKLRSRAEDYIQYQIRQQYYKDKLVESLQKIRQSLIEAWGLKMENGKAVNNLKESRYFMMWRGKREDISISPYWIQQFRVDFINNMLKLADNPKTQKKIIGAIGEFYRSGQKNATVTSKRLLNAYFEIFKETPVAVETLIKAGHFKGFESDQSKSDEENAKLRDDIIKQQWNALMKDYEDATYEYSTKKIKERGYIASKVIKAVHMFAKFAKWVTNAMFNLTIGKWQTNAITSIGAAFAITNGAIAVPAVAAGLFLGSRFISTVKDFTQQKLEYDTERKNTRRQEMNHLITSAALCENIDSFEDVNKYELDDFSDSDEFIQNVINGSVGDPNDVFLSRLRNVCNRQLKAMLAVTEKNPSEKQIQRLKEIIQWCDKALIKDSSNRLADTQTFILNYIDMIESDIAEANRITLSYKNEKDFSKIDPAELQKIRTNVLGAYKKLTSGYLQNGILKRLNIPTDVAEILVNKVNEIRINDAINNYQDLSDGYCNWIIDKYVDETQAKSLDKRAMSALKKNMKKWLNNEINGGQIGILSANTFTANASTSPIVRMVHQMLEEIDVKTRMEIQERCSKLNNLRNELESDWYRLDTQLHKFCERDANGFFTGYFVSKANIGQYLRDFEIEKERLRKIFNLRLVDNELVANEYQPFKITLSLNDKKETFVVSETQLSNSDFRADEENLSKLEHITAWQAYQMALSSWIGGGQYKEHVNSIIISDNDSPRAMRRYKPEYYIRKTQILGKHGVIILSDINSQIAQINAQCMESVEYNGKTYNIPIESRLDPSLKQRLDNAKNRKRLLASSVNIQFDQTQTKIINITEKNETEKELARRFQLWNDFVNKQYKTDEEIRLEQELNSLDPLNPQYSIIHEQYIKERQKRKEARIMGENLDVGLYNATIDKLKEEVNKYIVGSDEYNKAKDQLDRYTNDHTSKTYSEKLAPLIKLEKEYDYSIGNAGNELYSKFLSLSSVLSIIRHNLKRYDSHGQPYLDASLLGEGLDVREKENLWKQITMLETELNEIKKVLGYTEIHFDNSKRMLDMSQYVGSELTVNQNTRHTYKDELIALGIHESSLCYETISKTGRVYTNYSSLLYSQSLDAESVYNESPSFFNNDIEEVYNQVYSTVPIMPFTKSDSRMYNDQFDESSQEYVQVNSGRPEYDNTERYKVVENNKLYKEILKMMDDSWKCYRGFTRRSRYQMPQRHTSVGQMITRLTKNKVSRDAYGTAMKNIKNRALSNLTELQKDDYDNGEYTDVLRRADGSIVDTIPSRFISSLDDSNAIDTDIISSVIDFYTEAVRYKHRLQVAPLMEMLYFQSNGGFSNTGATAKGSQSDAIRSELSTNLYGRVTTGFGQHGRLSQNDAKLAHLSKLLRSAGHSRLMSHNWTSVLKNAVDSFLNMIGQAITGKYILPRSMWKALGFMASNAGTALTSIHTGKAKNMSQALADYNGATHNTHSRYSGLNKSWIRRGESKTFEFEIIDYTAKIIITEAVYDSYRLMYNPVTRKFQYMNSSQAEEAYAGIGDTRENGYKQWCKSDNTLRKAYQFDKKTGTVSLKKNNIAKVLNGGKLYDVDTYDTIRPKSNLTNAFGRSEDDRSIVFETMIATTIRQISSTVNGMLDTKDKPAIAKNYAGALITSFRGWMISQSSQYYKDGVDFYDTIESSENGVQNQKWFKQLSFIDNMVPKGTLPNENLRGQFNFSTGTIDRGLHRDLFKTIFKHLGTFFKMFMTFGVAGNKRRLVDSGKLATWEVYNLKNASFYLDTVVLLTAMTMLTYVWAYGDGDDDKGFSDDMSKLAHLALLASISERFSGITSLGFMAQLYELVKSVTVEGVLFDDAHFIFDSLMDMAELLSTENVDESDLSWLDKINNGTYKSINKGTRNLMRALPLLEGFLDFDTLPILLLMDIPGLFNVAPDWMIPSKKDLINVEQWSDLNLNFFKSHNQDAITSKGTFYEGLAKPVQYAVKGITNTASLISENVFDGNEIKPIPYTKKQAKDYGYTDNKKKKSSSGSYASPRDARSQRRSNIRRPNINRRNR